MPLVAVAHCTLIFRISRSNSHATHSQTKRILPSDRIVMTLLSLNFSIIRHISRRSPSVITADFSRSA